jgi:hypothetical protein
MKALSIAQLFGLLLMLSACTTPFERQWKTPSPAKMTGRFDGKWEGVWTSQKHTNAGGRLRCILTEQKPNTFHAQFKADWMVFSSGYSTVFSGKRKGEGVEFTGEQNLGRLFGGVYTFKGKASPRRFFASYDSSYDTGTFEMKRVEPSAVADRSQ